MRPQRTASSSFRSGRLACLALLLAAAATDRASAQTVAVDFDQVTSAPCTFDLTAPAHDEFASLGVHFAGPTANDGGAVLDQCGNFIVNPNTGIKFLAFNGTGATWPSGGLPIGPETVSFDQRVTNVDIWVASGEFTPATFTIDAFDGTTHVGANTVVTGPTWTLLSVTVAGGFSRVVLDTNVQIFLYDDLSFTPLPGDLYCFGDGTGAACPCGNNSPAGSMTGCLSSLGVGAHLDSSGIPSIMSDSVVLTGSQMPNSSVLYFQGTTQSAGGSGTVFGDGLRCASGTVIRLKSTTNVGGMSHYPGTGDVHVSVKGSVTAPGIRTYQAWYRNAAAFCTPSTFNLTNGLQLTWVP